MNSTSIKKLRGGKIPYAFLFPVMFLLLVACSQKEGGVRQEGSPQPDAPYYADNDIAMTVCSIVDALRVGEPLDSIGYNFVGVLTDGQGTPLYTDVEGAPGKWRVFVVDEQEARISNCRVGDLMAVDLRHYIVSALGLNSADLVSTYVDPHVEEQVVWLYDAGDIRISFAEIAAKSPSGAEGSLLTIVIGK